MKLKALFRRGQASYGLRDWVKTVDDFTTLEKDFPNEQPTAGRLLRAQKRLFESRTGKYDMSVLAPTFGRMFKHAVANFMAPVQIVNIPGKGRSLCAITDVPEGTLLLAAKAFALAGTDQRPDLTYGNGMLLSREVIRTFLNNPQRTTELYELDSGKIPRESIPDGIVDTDRIQAICEINLFLVENEFNQDGPGPDHLPCGLWTLSPAINHCLEEAVTSEQQMHRRPSLDEEFWDMIPRWEPGVVLQKLLRDLESTYPPKAQYHHFLEWPLLAVVDAAMREVDLKFGIPACQRILALRPRPHWVMNCWRE